MKLIKGVLLTLALGAATMGCYEHKIVVGSGGNEDGEAVYDSWESHWLFGTIGESEHNIQELCPSGNATIMDEVSFLNGLVGSLIGIVWYPSSVEIYCDGGAPAEEGKKEEGKKVGTVTLTPEQVREVALHPATMQWAKRIAPYKAIELQGAIAGYKAQQAEKVSTENVAAAESPVTGL